MRHINSRLIAALLLLITGIAFWWCLPEPLFRKPYSTVLLDRNGRLLQARIAADGQWRFHESENVPEKFAKAIVCFEDKRFFHHPGIDVLAIGRAMKQNLRAQKVVSGGSTLSMQVIRLSRNGKRNIFQKLLEMVLTLRLELSYTKQEILTLYANHAPFGGNVVGLETAAWRYFGRGANQLSWGEAAALAVLPNSPALVRPDRNREALLRKRNELLGKMKDQGIIDATTCMLAQQEPIPVKAKPLPEHAPQLLSSVQKGIYGTQLTDDVLKTTLDLNLQLRVNEILERHHRELKANGINNLAALVVKVSDGAVLSYAGNIHHPEDPETESFVDMIPAPRSPGSTLKPLLYAAALQDGIMLPGSLLPDIPTQVAGYAPQNFDLAYDGAVPAHEALARSLNVPAVRLLQQYRYERFHHLLKQLGMRSLNKGPDHYGLSLILGGGENSMWEITGIYASLARMLNHYGRYSGQYREEDLHAPRLSLKEMKSHGETKNYNAPLRAGAVFNMLEAMQELARPGEEQLWTQFTSSRRIAWKTGTSFGFRDGWAIGITPGHVICVWAGNADGEGKPTLTGILTAAPVMFELFRLLPSGPWFDQPYDDLDQKPICRKSGNIASAWCPETDTLRVAKATATPPLCTYHQLIHLDASGKFRVNSDCESPSRMQHRSWFVLPPAMEWYYRNHDPSYRPLPTWKPGCSTTTTGASMEMIYPKKGAGIFIPKELDGSNGKCIFEVAHRNKMNTIFWHLDDNFIGTTREFHRMGLSPSEGWHTLLLVDENGERMELPFQVYRSKPN